VCFVEDGVAADDVQTAVARMRATLERATITRCVDGRSGLGVASALSGVVAAVSDRRRSGRAGRGAGNGDGRAVATDRRGCARDPRATGSRVRRRQLLAEDAIRAREREPQDED